MSKISYFKVAKYFRETLLTLILSNPAESTEKPDRKAQEGQNNQLKYI